MTCARDRRKGRAPTRRRCVRASASISPTISTIAGAAATSARRVACVRTRTALKRYFAMRPRGLSQQPIHRTAEAAMSSVLPPRRARPASACARVDPASSYAAPSASIPSRPRRTARSAGSSVPHTTDASRVRARARGRTPYVTASASTRRAIHAIAGAAETHARRALRAGIRCACASRRRSSAEIAGRASIRRLTSTTVAIAGMSAWPDVSTEGASMPATRERPTVAWTGPVTRLPTRAPEAT